MKKILFILLTLVLLPSLVYSQSSQDQNVNSYLNRIDENINAQLSKISLAFNQTKDLAFKLDEIDNYNTQYNSLEALVDELFEIISSSKNEPNLTYTESSQLKELLSNLSYEYSETVQMVVVRFNKQQQTFIGLVGMTGENKVIKNKDDLDKIMDVYLSFIELTEHYNFIYKEIATVSNMFIYEKESNYDSLTCDRIVEYLNYCDNFDKTYKANYLLSKDSIVHNYFSLLDKYQSIKIVNETIVEEEEFKSSDTVEERNKKIGQQTQNSMNRIVFPVFYDFTGHYKKNKDNTGRVLYESYPTNFTEQLRKEVLELTEVKNCN